MAEEKDLDLWYETILEAVKEAGKILEEGFKSEKTVNTKAGPWDTVTEYDLKIEEFLTEKLNKAFPSHQILGEETGAKKVLTDDPTWIIDPIDGTNNFAISYNETCISVGLSVNKEVMIGIVHNPLKNQTFTARKGKGAYLNGSPIRVSNLEDIQQAVIAHEISLARVESVREELMKRFREIVITARGVRSIGCAAMTLCYVAMGVFNAYQIDHLFPWDLAAGALLVKEAGGVVLDSTGGEYDVMSGRILAAGTQKLADTIVSLIKKADSS